MIDFPRAGSLYKKRFRKGDPGLIIDGFDIPVDIPVMPKNNMIMNYDLKKTQQKFTRTEVPDNFALWDMRDQYDWASAEWHKRKNGLWIYINGRPIYIPGSAYVYFNHWICEYGGLPDFRMEAVEFFQVMDMIERDPQAFGLFIIKCRRLGDTEKALFYGWEYITRYYSSWFGMQNITEKDARDNYFRVVDGQMEMPSYFRPARVSPNQYPKTRLIYKLPVEEIDGDAKNLFPSLNCRVDYESTKFKRYDGKRLRFYFMDEPGKMTEMNPSRQWDVVKRCLSLF